MGLLHLVLVFLYKSVVNIIAKCHAKILGELGSSGWVLSGAVILVEGVEDTTLYCTTLKPDGRFNDVCGVLFG
jgi:hypothetical protein